MKLLIGFSIYITNWFQRSLKDLVLNIQLLWLYIQLYVWVLYPTCGFYIQIFGFYIQIYVFVIQIKGINIQMNGTNIQMNVTISKCLVSFSKFIVSLSK